MPAIVGGIVFLMLSTTAGRTFLLALLTYAVLQSAFGWWTYVPGGDNPAIFWTTMLFWAAYYVMAKLLTFVR